MKAKKNIVVLLLDTVRASDGYSNAMPYLSGLAREGTAYMNTISPATWTAPSHAALFTGTRASSISGVSKDFLASGAIDPWFTQTKFLPADAETLAKKVSRLGYTTALFSNNPFLTSFTNLGAGFDRIYDIWLESNGKYDQKLTNRMASVLKGGHKTRSRLSKASAAVAQFIPKRFIDGIYLSLRLRMDRGVANADGTHKLDRGMTDTNERLMTHLGMEDALTPQFLFMNFIEAHENYPVGRNDVIQDKWLYLSGILDMDESVTKLFHRGYIKRLSYLDSKVRAMISDLKKRGVLDNASVVITSDHGQFFGEHGLLYHALPPYEEVVKVPLIAINYENGRPVKTHERVYSNVSTASLHESLIDIAAGKSEYLNGNLRASRYAVSEHLGISEGWDGELLRMLKGRSEMANKIYETKLRHNKRSVAIYSGNMKLIHFFGSRKDELYDLKKDPVETDNIMDSRRSDAQHLLNYYGRGDPLPAA